MTEFPSSISPFEVQVDRQTPESWSEIVAQFTDASIYQTWAYGAVRWGAKNLSHLIMRQDGRIIAAAQLRIMRLPIIPVGMAYLRWGPMCQNKGMPLNRAVAREMIDHLRKEYVMRRGLALEIIPHAVCESDRTAEFPAVARLTDFQPLATWVSYRTVLVDLTPPEQVMRKNLDKKWRNQLNGAEKNGLVLEVADSQEAYREFLRLYEGMLARKKFETSVDVEEFGRMQELLPPPAKMKIFRAMKVGEAVGVLVCSLLGDTAIYLLGATNQKARELKASYFLQWQAMLWLKQHGAHWYDLGGIDSIANPGGYHFKSGFGGHESSQHTILTGASGRVSMILFHWIAWLRRRKSSGLVTATTIC